MAESPLIVRENGGTAVVGFRAQSMLDTITVEAISDELYALVDPPRKRGIVLDLSNVTFMSSPALSMLLTLRHDADEAGSAVVLCRPRPEIVRLLQITRLDRLFLCFETPAEALAHFVD